MLLVLVHLRCVGAIFTGDRHHPRAPYCAGLGHHCALAATVPNDPAFIDGAREALFVAMASACVVVSGRCEGCATSAFGHSVRYCTDGAWWSGVLHGWSTSHTQAVGICVSNARGPGPEDCENPQTPEFRAGILAVQSRL